MTKSILCFVAALGLTCALTSSAQTTYRLYYLGGQSNMDGYGYEADLPAELRAGFPQVKIFHGNPAPDNTGPDGNGIWAPLYPGHGVGFSSDGETNTYSDRFGVELSFAQRLLELRPNESIALIKYSRGGTSIDSAAADRFGSWDPHYRAKGGINQYDHFLNTIRRATAPTDLDGDGATDILEPAGIVLMQGESDGAHTEEIARRYEENLTELMNLIRAALRVDDLPVVVGRISDSRRDADGMVWNYGDLVRAAQVNFATKDPASAIVTETDRFSYSDTWHYDSEGYLELGRLFADAVHSLRKPTEP